MNNILEESRKEGEGELWLKKRNVQRLIFMTLCSSIGGIIGFKLSLAMSANPDLTYIGYIESVPLIWTIIFSFAMIGLLIYNWVRLDEFERPRYDKSSSFGLFAGLLIIPWYFSSLHGLFPAPNPMACLFLIFGAKCVAHTFFKYR